MNTEIMEENLLEDAIRVIKEYAKADKAPTSLLAKGFLAKLKRLGFDVGETDI